MSHTFKVGDCVRDSQNARRIVVGHLADGSAITAITHQDDETTLTADTEAIYDSEEAAKEEKE